MTGISVFFVSLVWYIAALAPSIAVGDAGEFCAAGTILGIAHSPGYPLYCLMGKAMTLLIPWGSIAYRFNLLSAIISSATLGMVVVLVRKVLPEGNTPGKNAASVSAALLLAFSPAFWHSALQAEVFAVNSFFAVLIFWALATRRHLFAVFVFGLGLGNHHTLLFLGPVILWSLIKDRAFHPRAIILLALGFFAGLSIYAYLPVRSVKNPALDWGNPESLHNLWRVISRADYGSLSLTIGEKMPRDMLTTLQQVQRFAAALVHQFTIAGVIIGCAGWYLGLRKKLPFFSQLFLAWCIAGPGFFLLANMPFTTEADGILERFYILGNLLWSFSLAAGIWYLLDRMRSKSCVAAAAVLLSVAPAFARFPSVTWREYYLAFDYGRNILRTLPQRAILFIDGGDDTFYSLAFLCFAEKKRPDIEVHDRGGLVFKNIYGADFRTLTKDEKEMRRQEVEKSFLGLRPIYFSTFNRDIMPAVELEPDGILYRQKSSTGSSALDCYALRGLYPDYRDYRSKALVPVYPYFHGVADPSSSLIHWQYAYSRWPEALWLGKNLAIEVAQQAYRSFIAGNYAAAEALYRQQLAWSPNDASALVNRGVIAEKRNDIPGAKALYRQVIERDPQNVDAYYNTAVLYWKEANWQKVCEYLRMLLAVKPDDQRALHYLPLALEKLNASQNGHRSTNQ